jgi:hypothetical protein
VFLGIAPDRFASAPSAARDRACDARGKITKAGLDALEKGELRADTEVKGFVAACRAVSSRTGFAIAPPAGSAGSRLAITEGDPR